MVSVTTVDGDPVATRGTEFVERKGIGHPDSLCDGVAEAVSRRLSRFYREEFGRVLHHNTDKVHLGAGQATPEYGGGTLEDPIYVLLGGRATTRVDGRDLPVESIAREAARTYLLETVPTLAEADVVVDTRIGASSSDLASLFDRGAVPLANDTSFGVGHAPLSPTERFIRTLAPRLHEEIAAVGKDVKLMGYRQGDHLSVTVAAAIIDSAVADLAAYRDVVEAVETLAEHHLEAETPLSVSVTVNAADDYDTGDVYLTTTGLSAETGDDGAAGRGNRSNGLITPHRSMSLEAAAGKNPVTHVGKLYNLLATRIADALDTEYAGVHLLSQIGAPVTEPVAVDVTTTMTDTAMIDDVVTTQLESIDALTESLIDGSVTVF